jgi:hypothetical protein
MGIEPGDQFWGFFGIILGYYFGAKSTQTTTLALREALKNVQVGR